MKICEKKKLGENLTRKACKREKVLNKIENTEKIMKIREKIKKIGRKSYEKSMQKGESINRIENTEKLVKIWEKMKKIGRNLKEKYAKGRKYLKKLKIRRNS